MKARWIVIVILCGAAALLVTYVARNTYWDEISLSMPLRGEAAINPFYASQKLAEALGATTQWRHSLGTLPAGEATVVLSQWHWDLIHDRRRQLEDWVKAGGHIVVDTTLIGGEEHLASWAGIRHEHPRAEDAADPVHDEKCEQPGTGESDFVDRFCDKLQAVDAAGKAAIDRTEFAVCRLAAHSALTTDRPIAWGVAGRDGIQALRVKIGRGSVTAINADPFGNLDLLEMDHARFLVAALQLRRGDHVIFVSEGDHTPLLALIWLHGAPVVVLFLLMLAALLWRGGVRFGPLGAATDSARRSIAEQIRGTGQFTIRLGGGKALHAAAVRALHEAAGRRIAHYPRLAHAERVAAIARATGIDHDTLAQAINHGGPQRPGELTQTIGTLESARRRILNRHDRR